MHEILLVGEAPSRKGDGTPFSGPAGERLSKMLGRPLHQVFDVCNLIEIPDPSRAAFRNTLVHARARKLVREAPQLVVLLAGRVVAGALDLSKLDFFECRSLFDHDVYVVPHPSGRNHWFNDPRHMVQCAHFYRDLLGL